MRLRLWLLKITGWKFLRPARAPWGESTKLWTDEDWRWFRKFHPAGKDGISLTSMESPPELIDDLADAIRSGKLSLRQDR